MDLASLVAGLSGAEIVGDPSTEVADIVYHATDVRPGALFVCIPGLRADGHAFAGQAVAAGATALLCERPLDLPVAQVVVPSSRRAMALACARFLGDPTRELVVAAVTGTNGKTTTAHLLYQIFAAAGRTPALLGTVVNRIGGVEQSVQLTTAESCELQRMFRAMVEAGDRSCAMEASSHALALERTTGIDFDAVVFTNLTRDHLDFHRDLDDYFLAKRRLFLPDEERQPHAVAVINVGDEFGRRLAAECAPRYGDDLWTYAVEDELDGAVTGQASGAPAAASHVAPVASLASGLDLRPEGSSFTLTVARLNVKLRVRVHLAARFNVTNALAAATTALALGIDGDAVRVGLDEIVGVPGRFEAVRAGQPFTVLVDYAHTPDSLANALQAARGIAAGRLICVFGCGGDRDRGKRPLMGAVAADLADLVWVTSDNPRSEDPQAIIGDILTGAHGDHVRVEPDRRAAIAAALGEARPGDVVVIAGKGHESGQVIGATKLPFDDGVVAAEELRTLGFRSSVTSRPAGGERR